MDASEIFGSPTPTPSPSSPLRGILQENVERRKRRRFAALLLIPALLLFALLLVRPEPSKLREGVPSDENFSGLQPQGAFSPKGF